MLVHMTERDEPVGIDTIGGLALERFDVNDNRAASRRNDAALEGKHTAERHRVQELHSMDFETNHRSRVEFRRHGDKTRLHKPLRTPAGEERPVVVQVFALDQAAGFQCFQCHFNSYYCLVIGKGAASRRSRSFQAETATFLAAVCGSLTAACENRATSVTATNSCGTYSCT